jgi:hypothetical protein
LVIAGALHKLPAVSGNQQRRTLFRERKQQGREARRASFKSGRDLLRKHGVPFDPDLLLERGFKKELAPVFATMPEFKESRLVGKQIEGVQIADSLFFPETVELTGDTVILANQLIFSGRNVVIKGPHDLHFFAMGPIQSVDLASEPKGSNPFVKASFSREFFEASKRTGRLVAPNSITLNIDALGRDEWLLRKKEAAKKPRYNNHARFSQQQENIDESPGATGATGPDGDPSQEPPVADIGPPGLCPSVPNGLEGDHGHQAPTSGNGGTGLRGIDGNDAGVLNIYVQFGDTHFFSLSARGGRGGQGGTGGYGGAPGRGGKGGTGGPGATCNCPLQSGKGGKGGTGGTGSHGGRGGDGGSGADGGKGGTIYFTYACDWTPNYSYNVNPGGKGPGGVPGLNSPGGPPGFGGDAGTGGSNISCLDKAGGTFGRGADGEPGSNNLDHGSEGPLGGQKGMGAFYPDEDCGDYEACELNQWYWNFTNSTCQESSLNPGCTTDQWGFWNPSHTCNYWYTGCDCLTDTPILLDIAGDDFDLTDAQRGVLFDINADGIADQISWTAANSDDAFLALDRNGNGSIDDGKELFGNYTPQSAASTANGFVALAEYDKTRNGGNGDGAIDNHDSIFSSLRLWQDTNHNGFSEPFELKSLAEMGIEAISLDYRESRRQDRFGNVFRFRGKAYGVNHTDLGRWAYDVILKRAN